jgi:hypothetical protein
MEPLSKYY